MAPPRSHYLCRTTLIFSGVPLPTTICGMSEHTLLPEDGDFTLPWHSVSSKRHQIRPRRGDVYKHAETPARGDEYMPEMPYQLRLASWPNTACSLKNFIPKYSFSKHVYRHIYIQANYCTWYTFDVSRGVSSPTLQQNPEKNDTHKTLAPAESPQRQKRNSRRPWCIGRWSASLSRSTSSVQVSPSA